MSDTNVLLRSIPAMDELLNAPWAAAFCALMGRDYVKTTITEVLDTLRHEIINKTSHTEIMCLCDSVKDFSEENQKAAISDLVVNRAEVSLRERSTSTLKSVVNATGVVIHTNLGRAPLAKEALKAVNGIAGTYSTLEYSPEKGGRAGRNSHIEWLICHITGAEAALVVNNNAAAVLLALSATASGRELIVSNGELVEIGDSFRIPEILSFSGAKMIAVGCTNSTRIGDYRDAITENTAVILKVHPSNYRISGFVSSASREELSALASSRGLVFMEDLGSGLLCPIGLPFTHIENTVRDCLEAGANIVTFSGDKLLGGPQIGVIAGSKQIIGKMRNHQLLRALRVDKMTLAAFEATLRIYISGRQGDIPVIKMMEMKESSLLKKARRLCTLLKKTAKSAGADDFAITVVKTNDAIGGGAFPADQLPGFGVGIHSASISDESLALGLRTARFPVIPGIQDGLVILHARTLLENEEKIICASFKELLSGTSA